MMLVTTLLAGGWLFALLPGAAGCQDPVETEPPATDCHSCHGSEENAAPPLSIGGATETTELGVGAHQAHLHESALRAAVECDECHTVPNNVDDPGHPDGSPAELSFGTLAVAGNSSPQWDRQTAKCTNVYCHGATLAGGANQAPVWTVVDGSQAFCGSCHGIPPLAPHPAEYDCTDCHAGTVLEDGGIDVAGGLHINGTVDFGGVGCGSCHGNEDNNAPPQAIDGATETTELSVGAHQSHVLGGSYSAPVACDACHTTPETIGQEGHIDSSPAEVTWGTLATTDGAGPIWQRSKATCSGTYCHGATLTGGSNNVPTWTNVDGSQATCGTCHGLPPTTHGPIELCHACHTETTEGTEGSVTIKNPKLHINGQVDY